jgi:hypothetical protein
MPTHKTVKVGGKRKQFPVAYFWKDVIGVGKFRHPITGQTFEVDEKRIDGWVRKYEKMREQGIEIPTPVDHSDNAEDNRGFVVGARRVGDKLQLLHQVIGEDGARLACRNRCSVYIDPEFMDEHGKNWGEAIAHSAFTPKPVISGQGEFVPFAASRATGSGKTRKVPVFYLSRSKESDMAAKMKPGKRRGKKGNSESKLSPKKAKKVRKLLSIEDDEEVTDEELLKRLASHPAIAKAAKRAVSGDDEEEDDDDELVDEEEDTDEDDADDESDEDDEEEDDDAEADDELEEDDSDEDADDEEDDEDEDDTKKKKRSKNRKRILAERSKNRKRELVGSIGSLSRVPKGADPTTLTLLRRSFKTERQKLIAKGAITPEVDQALCDLLFSGKQFNGLALSRMPGSEDPLAFRLYSILKKNKPVPMNGGRTGNQEAIALGRKVVGRNGGVLSPRDREALREEVRAQMGVASKKKAKKDDE